MPDFRDLHRPGAPLLLPNAWDVASALALAGAGFAAIGTTSLGVAAAHGLPDGRQKGKTQTIDLVRALHGRLDIPLTVDAEDGFGGSPAEVADLAAALHAHGAAGINLEDGRPGGTPAPVDDQAAMIAAVKQKSPDLFVNARTDTHWTKTGDLTEALFRARTYLAAGADGVFVPAVAADDDIRALVALGAPLNVLLLPGMTVQHLAGLGVARISTGSLLFRVALSAAVGVARDVAAGAPAPAAALTYAEANALSG